MDYQQQDPQLWQAIAAENQRQKQNIELIASENIVSQGVLNAQGSILTNKYAEGYPGKRYYGGTQYIDVIEQLAIDRAKELFHASYVNVQPHSGSQANEAAYRALIKPGDRVLGMNLDAGGHLTHGSAVNFSGKTYEFHAYGVDNQGFLDYEAIAQLAIQVRPQLIVAGASAYSRQIDFRKFRQIADSVNAKLMVDMAHIAGLVATDLHPSPVGIADIVTTTTHKTLRGPRGGMILADQKYAKKINSAVFPGTQGGPLEHVIAAKAVALYEALQPEFTTYMQQVITNAQAMAAVFNQENNLNVLTGGTDNHLMTLDLSQTPLNGAQAQDLLDILHITTNKEAIPNDPLPPSQTSGLRLGTPAITSRGFLENDSQQTAELIIAAFKNYNNPRQLSKIKEQVLQLTSKHPLI
ncbi:serine hydroxymethyltransferase [Bombilactobacillus thymidiniphilus]|uniref:Serine hydroxymethyltransferase n=1 Tax=Bombilactobacillus thymidiniphilus TaxID=2923363 RepID=A0ABY4PFN9_9LACO|nr:serine hydroxymethyltransferase [Bombilactobacillus thymidiniphilus]UQS84324.1 serine hydroxymethyltransferase [Bombilactobacillus thymidiniphilus]